MRKCRKNLQTPETLTVTLHAIWHPKSSKKVENHFFQNKSFFSIPKELGIQTFRQISFLSDSGTILILHSESTFFRILENEQMSCQIWQLPSPQLRSASKSHFAPRIDFWADLAMFSKFRTWWCPGMRILDFSPRSSPAWSRFSSSKNAEIRRNEANLDQIMRFFRPEWEVILRSNAFKLLKITKRVHKSWFQASLPATDALRAPLHRARCPILSQNPWKSMKIWKIEKSQIFEHLSTKNHLGRVWCSECAQKPSRLRKWLNSVERRITSHSDRKKCMIWSKFASFRLFQLSLSLKSLTIQLITVVKKRVSASSCTTKFWTLKTLLGRLRNQFLARNETCGQIWARDLAASKFGSSSAHFWEIWKMSIPSGKFESFQNRPEMRSDKMFGFPTRLGWKKRFILKNSIFDFFGRFSVTDCL